MSKSPKKYRTNATANALKHVEEGNNDEKESSGEEDKQNPARLIDPKSSTPSLPSSMPTPVIPVTVTPSSGDDVEDDLDGTPDNRIPPRQCPSKETLQAPRYPPSKESTPYKETLNAPRFPPIKCDSSPEPQLQKAPNEPVIDTETDNVLNKLMCLKDNADESGINGNEQHHQQPPPKPEAAEHPKASRKLREKEYRAAWREQNKGKLKRWDDIRGHVLVDSLSLSERYGPKDPMKFTMKRKDGLKKFSKKCEDAYNDELQKCNFTTNIAGTRFTPNTHASREGQRWMNIFPLYCIIPVETDRTQFSVVNFTSRIMEVKIRITGSDNFEISPKLTFVEPFSCESVHLVFHRRRKMQKPDERLTLYFNDYYDLERMRKEFGKDKIDLTKHYAGKLTIGVFIHNWQIKHTPKNAHISADVKDAQARAVIYAKEHHFAYQKLNQSPTERQSKDHHHQQHGATKAAGTITADTVDNENVRKKDWGKAAVHKTPQQQSSPLKQRHRQSSRRKSSVKVQDKHKQSVRRRTTSTKTKTADEPTKGNE